MEADCLSSWRLLDSRKVHVTPWFDVSEDTVIRPDGVEDVYHHVVTPGSVTVVALDADERVMVTRQWIYTHNGAQWRLPSGGVDQGDADPRAAAIRELAEETGLHAARWEEIGVVHEADSLTNHVDHIFLATELTMGTPRPGVGESDLDLHWLPFQEALALVTTRKIRHAGSAYGLLSVGVTRRQHTNSTDGACSPS
ncbi:NUDIX hydrolase [Solihabitans fulvus]|uniref:NUDIX hydrolase n=1 Tax=Solihabitans fulvus TaxID=1892852 RepID=A0A5B2XD62_9PSEU|nr:NUDIX hydrolase [Solihabitans fulvus]KAA2261283.1 NUDIX hydrolase [Solihabitans fulvus]